MRAIVAPGLCLILLASGCTSDTDLRSTASAPTLVDDFSTFAIGQTWDEGETVGGWTNAFDGFGSAFSSAINSILGFVSSAFNGVLGVISRLLFAAGDEGDGTKSKQQGE